MLPIVQLAIFCKERSKLWLIKHFTALSEEAALAACPHFSAALSGFVMVTSRSAVHAAELYFLPKLDGAIGTVPATRPTTMINMW